VGLEARVRELEAELKRVEQERDILTVLTAHWRSTALSIFGRDK
jgi:transposase-like protein